jgi:ATP-dependent Lhr-like helicase
MNDSHSKPTPTRRPLRQQQAVRQVVEWMNSHGWKPFPFQKQTWSAYLNGESGLIHATTGTGKTLAAWLGPVAEALAEAKVAKPGSKTSKKETAAGISDDEPPLRVLWITPLRALAIDTEEALLKPLQALLPGWTLESRTGDTSTAVRNRQRKRLPTALITTPESLSLLLTRPDAQHQLRQLRCIICDEWHELMSTKRGVQVELALARLRRWKPELRVWGLSATLGNLDEAMSVLLGNSLTPAGRITPADRLRQTSQVQPAARNDRTGTRIQGETRRKIVIDTLIPATIERFPWAGHLGLRQLPSLIEEIDQSGTSLVFTNTRSQTEAWYHAMLGAKPEWAGQIAVHHGSLDQQTRSWVEDGLRRGTLKSVVCTSSLDLGVDFSPVDRVFQVGSPKGVARLLQRAGRSGHRPGAVSRATCIPTHALELIEIAAARDAISAGFMEGRDPHRQPLDVLCQHAVTVALGTGFAPDDLLDEVRNTASYSDLSEHDWQWVVDFVSRGGQALRAYPDYHRLKEADGLYVIGNQKAARQHRMAIGTIVSDASLIVQYLNGPRLGTVEESFLTRLKPGDCFALAGRTVELVHIHDMIVWVRRAKSSKKALIPRWMGGRMPLSTELATAVRHRLQQASEGRFSGPEMEAVRPVLELQQERSLIPLPHQLLIERVRSREGHHLFFYPFAGRLVHEGLSALFAWRLAQKRPATFSMSVNDYGFELLSPTEVSLHRDDIAALISDDHLARDIDQSLNAAEMGKRQFREIARVSGLVFQGFPGQQKSARQLQASSGLLYDVFANYDPDNLLLAQSRREVLERQLEHSRLLTTLKELRESEVILSEPDRFTPLCFPLLVDRLRSRLSNEQLSARIARMQISLEK